MATAEKGKSKELGRRRLDAEAFRLLVEQVADYAIFLLGPDGRVISWNRGAQRLKGWRAEEIIGEHFSRFYTERDRAAHKPDLELSIAREVGRVEDEGWRVRKDGSRFWANVVITAIRDPSGELRGFAKVTRDVTERRRLAFLGEASAILLSSLDYEATLTRVAELCVPFIADWSSVALLTDHTLKTVAVMHPDPAKRALAFDINRRFPEEPANGATWRAIRSGQPELIAEITDERIDANIRDPEHARLLKQLGLRSALIVPLIAGGRTLGALSFVLSESGRRFGPEDIDLARELAKRCATAIDNARAHGAVQVEREFLEAVVRQMREGVLVTEAAGGRPVLVNDEALRILRIESVDELMRRQQTDFRRVDGTPLSPEELPIERSLRRGVAVGAEELVFNDGDESRVISVASAPVRDGAGRVVGAVATFRDITERKRAEERAAHEAATREMFFGILGHDLRTPLSAIMTSAHLLANKPLGATEARTVGRISSSAERMAKLISDLLDLTRTRLGGGIAISRRRVELEPLCRRIVDEISVAKPGCDVRLETHGTPIAQLDPDRIAQVISNLVSNAVQYGCEARVCLDETDSEVRIVVHNRGEPIPPELLPVIFDPFQRASAQPDGENPKGLGLGLYIASEIVRAHGGSIDVRSNPEQGTTFRVRLPKLAPLDAHAAPPG